MMAKKTLVLLHMVNRMSLFVLGLLLLPNLSSCQPKDHYDIYEYKDLSYIEGNSTEQDSLQKLNLVIPGKGEGHPLLIWIGGGAWSYGDKDQEMDLAKQLCSQGIAVASVGHRLSPAIWRDSLLKSGVQHPKHVEDIAASIKWLNKNAHKYGYDRNQFFIGGYSSGAHLAALVTLDSTYLHQVGLSPKLFKGVIPISGTYDIMNYREVLKSGDRPELVELHVDAVFGKKSERHLNASPTSYLDNLYIPMLLISDNSLSSYTKLFEDEIKKTGFIGLRTVYVDGLSHGELWRDLSHNSASPYRKMMVRFIQDITMGGDGMKELYPK